MESPLKQAIETVTEVAIFIQLMTEQWQSNFLSLKHLFDKYYESAVDNLVYLWHICYSKMYTYDLPKGHLYRMQNSNDTKVTAKSRFSYMKFS